MKFTFIAEEENLPYSGYRGLKSTVEFKADTLADIVCSFEDFLKGLGFHIDGVLDIVPHDDYNGATTDEDSDDSMSITISSVDLESMGVGAAQPAVDTEPFHFSSSWPFSNTVPQESYEETAKDARNKVESALNGMADEDRCPVCRLTKKQMQGMSCWDPNCGLGKNNAKSGNYYS